MRLYFTFLFLIILYIYLSNVNIINEPFNESKSVVNIYENISKDVFEKIVNNKSPTIFTNINTKTKSDINNMNDKVKKIFEPYIIPYCITHKYDIQNENKNSYGPLIKQTSYRYLFLLLKGEKKIILFSPSQKPNLYTQTDISPVNFWDSDDDKFPKFNNVKYLEINLKANEMLYIPFNWWFTSFNLADTVSVSSISECLSSYFLKTN